MNNTGNVEAISEKNNSVCIDNQWYKLGPKVKTKFIKKGKAEYTMMEEEGEAYVTFIKSVKDEDEINKTPIKPENAFKSFNMIESEAMKRMSAIKSASTIFEATGKGEEMKALAEEILKFIEVGKFD